MKKYKHKIGHQLTHRLAYAIKYREISVIEAPLVSKYILEHIDDIKDHDDLLHFLTDLSHEWPFFSDVLVQEMRMKLGKRKKAKVEVKTAEKKKN